MEISVLLRFEKHVEIDYGDNCWTWSGKRNKKGYGGLWINKNPELVHRISWIIFRGPIPKGMCVLHSCDNPPCVRPNHLFLGTKTNNSEDMVSKGRQASGERNGRAKLSKEKASLIKNLYLTSEFTQRQLAERFEVCKATIGQVVRGERWYNA